MVVVTGCHSPDLSDNRYRVSGRRVVGPYGGIVAVCHSSGLGGYRYLGGGRFVNRPYGVIVAASVFRSVGRDCPKGTGSTYRSCFAVCRWRCVSRLAGWRGCGRAGAALGAPFLALLRPSFPFSWTDLAILCVLHSYYVKNSAIFQFPFPPPPYYNGHR